MISLLSNIGLLILGIGLFLFMMLVRKALSLIRLKKARRNLLNRFFPIVEVIVWLAFLIWVIYSVFRDQPTYLLALFGLVAAVFAWASWFAIKDMVSGAILKTEDVYEINCWVRINDIEGRIRKAGYRSLEIETEQGENVKIPYSMISRELLVKTDYAEPSKAHTFRLDLPKTLPVTEAIQKIRTSALNSVWSSIKREPQIELSEENANGYKFEVTVYALHSAYFSAIESEVRRAFATK